MGIDLSPLAATLVKARLEKEMGLFYDINHREDIPRRTDLGTLPNYHTHKHTLYGKQEGILRGMPCHVPLSQYDGRSYHPTIEGWVRSSGKFATAVWGLQFHERHSVARGVYCQAEGRGTETMSNIFTRPFCETPWGRA